MSKEKQKRADGFEQIEEATISTEQFIEKNQKLLVRGVLVIIIVVGVILGYYSPDGRRSIETNVRCRESF